MKIYVGQHKVKIDKEPINEKEINVSKCEFEFDESITDDFVKEAYFTLEDNTYKKIIANNECDIPYEVLIKKGVLEIGVVATKVIDEENEIRYNPTPDYIDTWQGSLKEAENSEPITPSEMEQYMQLLEAGLQEVSNVDIDLEQLENGVEVTIVDRNGVTKTGTVLDGIGLQYNWLGTELGIKREDELVYDYVDLKGDKPIKGVDYFTPEDIESLNIPRDTNDLTNGAGFITKNVNDLTNYTLATDTGSTIELNINSSTYVMTLNLKNSIGTIISTGSVDLPLESVVVSGYYDSINKKIVLTLENGNTIDVPVGDLINGLQTEINSSNKLNSDYVDDTGRVNRFTNVSEKAIWNSKYNKPSGGIPKSDLDSSVQTSLGKADTALQEHQDLSDYVKSSDLATVATSGDYDDLINKPTYIVIEDSSNYGNSSMSIDTTENRNDVIEIYTKYKDLQKTILLEIKNEYNKVVLIPINEITKENNKLTLKFDYVSSMNSPSYGYPRLVVKTYKINVNFNNDEISLISGTKNLIYEYPLASSEVLGINNTTSFTPTGDYNPATKKYVDDSISSAIGTALGGIY